MPTPQNSAETVRVVSPSSVARAPQAARCWAAIRSRPRASSGGPSSWTTRRRRSRTSRGPAALRRSRARAAARARGGTQTARCLQAAWGGRVPEHLSDILANFEPESRAGAHASAVRGSSGGALPLGVEGAAAAAAERRYAGGSPRSRARAERPSIVEPPPRQDREREVDRLRRLVAEQQRRIVDLEAENERLRTEADLSRVLGPRPTGALRIQSAADAPRQPPPGTPSRAGRAPSRNRGAVFGAGAPRGNIPRAAEGLRYERGRAR